MLGMVGGCALLLQLRQAHWLTENLDKEEFSQGLLVFSGKRSFDGLNLSVRTNIGIKDN